MKEVISMINEEESAIYERIRELRRGSIEERRMAIECEKLLSDYYAKESLEEKLCIIISRIEGLG